MNDHLPTGAYISSGAHVTNAVIPSIAASVCAVSAFSVHRDLSEAVMRGKIRHAYIVAAPFLDISLFATNATGLTPNTKTRQVSCLDGYSFVWLDTAFLVCLALFSACLLKSPVQPSYYSAAPPAVRLPQATLLTSDPPRHSQLPQSPIQSGYFNEAPVMKVSQTMKAFPGMEVSVSPVMRTQEDHSSIPTSPDMEQEHSSPLKVGHATNKGQCPSQVLTHQDAIHMLPEHTQKELLMHLAKSIQVPAVEEVAHCTAGEKHLVSSGQDSLVENRNLIRHLQHCNAASDSEDVPLENDEQTVSHHKPELAMQQKEMHSELNLKYQREQEKTQSDCKSQCEPADGTDKVGGETGDVNRNTASEQINKGWKADEGGGAIQHNAENSEHNKSNSETPQLPSIVRSVNVIKSFTFGRQNNLVNHNVPKQLILYENHFLAAAVVWQWSFKLDLTHFIPTTILVIMFLVMIDMLVPISI